MIKATENFKMGVVAANGGIALLYLASFVAGLLQHQRAGDHDSSWLGIAFSLFVVVVAALKPGAGLRLHRNTAWPSARRSTWSGMAHSA